MKELFVINIGRQLGSGGRAVGEIISRRLGIRLYDKELLTLAAKQSGLCPACFEKVDEKQGRGVFATMIAYLRSPFGADMSSVNNVLSNDALFKVQSDVIRDLASRESCIFVGRCADYILRDHPRCVNVFVSASPEARIERLTKLHHISEEEAEELMEKADKKRSSYYNYYSYKTWGAAATYHLCIDSSVLGIDETVKFIKQFVKQKLQLP